VHIEDGEVRGRGWALWWEVCGHGHCG
jgi:hypothetical protein